MSRRRDDDTQPKGPQCSGLHHAYMAPQYHRQTHPAGRLHPPCPHCGAALGCSRCAGPWAETICTKCVSWACIDGFIEHGAFLNTPVMISRRGGSRARTFAEYPPSWQRAYRQANRDDPTPDPAILEDMQRRFAP